MDALSPSASSYPQGVDTMSMQRENHPSPSRGEWSEYRNTNEPASHDQDWSLLPQKKKICHGHWTTNLNTDLNEEEESWIDSSDDTQLFQIRAELESYRLDRQRNERRMEQALYGAPMLITRSQKHLTEPKDFDFATDRRFGPPLAFQRNETEKSSSPLSHPLKLTIPQPFHFHLERRLLSHLNQQETTLTIQVTPLAERIRKIENATPEHWKNIVKKRSPQRVLTLTRPESFCLHTDMRIKSLPPKKQDPINPSPPPFKALPLNRQILESLGHLGLPRVVKRLPTHAKSPKLHVNQRCQLRSLTRNIETVKSPNQNHTQPSPPHLLNRPMKLTIPESPCLKTQERSNLYQSQKTANTTPILCPFKARPMPTSTYNVHSKSVKVKELTRPEPFCLITELRGQEDVRRRQEYEKDRQIKQLERCQFHAHPMPIVEPFKPIYELKVTEFDPFDLESVERHEWSRKKLEEEALQAEQERLNRLNFKAREFHPLPPPNPIQKSSRPLTVVSDFVLNSEIRAVQRNAFDSKKRENDEMKKNEKKRFTEIEAVRREENIKRIRSKIGHKAVSVPKTLYIQPLPVKSSDKPLTEPKMPNLWTKRLRAGRDI